MRVLKQVSKKLTLLFLVAVMVFAVCRVDARAATPQGLKAGTWISLKTNYDSNYRKNNTVYKLVLKKDARVSIYWKGAANNRSNISIYTNAGTTNHVKSVNSYNVKSGVEVIALAKGTYYVQMYDGSSSYSYRPTTKVKFVATAASKINKLNFSRGRAIKLAAGKKARIVQTPNSSYYRWYKIVLPKAKVINVYTNKGMGYNISLYDTKWNRLSVTSGSQQVTTQKKYAKGTYYIRVTAPTNFGTYSRLGEYVVLKWK